MADCGSNAIGSGDVSRVEEEEEGQELGSAIEQDGDP